MIIWLNRYTHLIFKKITTLADQAPISSEEKNRLRQYTVFLLLGIPTMALYAVYNLFKAEYFLCALIFTSGIGLLIGWYLLRKLSSGGIIYRINVILFGLLLLYMVFVGGQGGSKILWMYTFPLIVFFLLGRDEGLWWCLGAGISTAGLFWLSTSWLSAYYYPAEFKIRFLTTFLIVAAIAYWFEHFRQTYLKGMENEQRQLEQEKIRLKYQIAERQKAETALEEAAAELETRVRDRTADLERTNRLLKLEVVQRRRIQENLKIAKEEAEAASMAKSEFLANMSHELRTPLNHIMGFTELVVGHHFGSLNDRQQEYLQHVVSSSRHLLTLIDDILEFSKAAAGKLELHVSTVELKELLEESLKVFEENALTSGNRLSLELEQVTENIRADLRMLRQIIYNLMSNAIKFSPDGGTICLKARMYSADTNGSTGVEISVSDTGIGIRKKDIRRIFNTFELLENSKSRRFTGTGLGLPLSKKFVELHGGRIWAESDGVGRGSTFRFFIPQPLPEASGA